MKRWCPWIKKDGSVSESVAAAAACTESLCIKLCNIMELLHQQTHTCTHTRSPVCEISDDVMLTFITFFLIHLNSNIAKPWPHPIHEHVSHLCALHLTSPRWQSNRLQTLVLPAHSNKKQQICREQTPTVQKDPLLFNLYSYIKSFLVPQLHTARSRWIDWHMKVLYCHLSTTFRINGRASIFSSTFAFSAFSLSLSAQNDSLITEFNDELQLVKPHELEAL